jgi:mRNA interferase RelE/StbE
MTYKLDFKKKGALKEWKKLGSTLQQQFKKKLIERLDNPHVPASKLSGADNMYKIKLRQSGYRLVYKVEDGVIIVTVLAVGKRERSESSYHQASATLYSDKQITKLYRQLAKQLHPDKEIDEEKTSEKSALMPQLSQAKKDKDVVTLFM